MPGFSPRIKAKKGRFGVGGLPAVIRILSAVVNSVGSPATFTLDASGTATDPELGNVSASIAWSSDVDGALGTGASISSVPLSAGPHVITATFDDGTNIVTATRNVTAA